MCVFLPLQWCTLLIRHISVGNRHYFWTTKMLIEQWFIDVCDIIRNTYLVFAPGSWQGASKTLRISWRVEVIGVSFVIHNKPFSTLPEFYDNEVTLDGPLDSFRMGLVAKRTSHVIRGLDLWIAVHAPVPPPLEMESGWRLNLITSGQWYNKSCLCEETSIKNPYTMDFGDFSGWWTHQGARKLSCLKTAWGFCAPSPIPRPLQLFGYSWIILYNQLVTVKRASLEAQTIKNLPAMQETRVQFLGQEDPLEKGMATHSSMLA